jgi:hypothetical protein
MTHSITRLLVLGALLATDAAAQTIALSADSLAFSGRVGGTNPATQTIVITNTGGGALTWRITSTPRPWLSVAPPRGGAPANLVFSVSLTGLRAGAYQDTVKLATNAPASPRKEVVVVLNVRAGPSSPPTAGPPMAEYEVAFVYIGYTGVVDGYPNCAVKTTGTDSLIGILRGVEASNPDDDVEYTGNLARATAMDICETKGANRPDDINDEQVWCVASLAGTSRMNVKLTVHGEADRGAYLKAIADTSRSTSQVTGNCAQTKMTVYRTDYPRRQGGGGGEPDGQAISDAFGTVRFSVGGLGRLRVGRYPSDPSQTLAGSPTSGWALHVIRKIR